MNWHNCKKSKSYAAAIVRRYLFSLIIIMCTLVCAGCSDCDDEPCIAADDMGTGGTGIIIKANPESLFPNTPKNDQVSRWIDTGFFSVGLTSNDAGEIVTSPITGQIKGSWFPWGPGVACTNPLPNCDPSKSSSCLGTKESLDERGVEVKEIRGSEDCELKNGQGLYLLIAMQNSEGNYGDPNEGGAQMAKSPPVNDYRTIHLGASVFTKGGGYFSVPYSLFCSGDTTQGYKCQKDSKQGVKGGQNLASGRVYLKIVDSYYGDNRGNYEVIFNSGVYKTGFIQSYLTMINKLVTDAAKISYETVYKKIAQIVRALLLLYLVVTGLLFAMGLIRVHHSELVIRSLKIAIIITVISPGSYAFFSQYLFSLFKDMASYISKLIVATAFQLNANTAGKITVAKDVIRRVGGGSLDASMNFLIIYDYYFGMLTSTQIHAKIWSLLGSVKFYFIFLLYVLIILFLVTILKAIMLYILAFMQISLLIIVFPIFIVMILFQTTKEIFDRWLGYMANSSILIVITTATVALMFLLISPMLDDLLRYTVCFRCDGLWGFIKFWEPINKSEMDGALDILRYLNVLMYTLLFYIFVGNIGSIADSLTASTSIGGISAGGYGTMMGGLTDKAGSVVDSIRGAYTKAQTSLLTSRDPLGSAKSIGQSDSKGGKKPDETQDGSTAKAGTTNKIDLNAGKRSSVVSFVGKAINQVHQAKDYVKVGTTGADYALQSLIGTSQEAGAAEQAYKGAKGELEQTKGLIAQQASRDKLIEDVRLEELRKKEVRQKMDEEIRVKEEADKLKAEQEKAKKTSDEVIDKKEVKKPVDKDVVLDKKEVNKPVDKDIVLDKKEVVNKVIEDVKRVDLPKKD